MSGRFRTTIRVGAFAALAVLLTGCIKLNMNLGINDDNTVSGTIQFSGPLHEDGRYSLIAHSGSVFLRSTTAVNATVSVATVGGAFRSPLPHTVSERRASIFTARFGSGAAQVTMESFSGALVVEEAGP